MRKQVIIMIGMLLIIPMLAISSTLTTAQVSEAEAKQIFENIGCVSCHVGQPLQPAASWDLIVQFMQDWSQKYPTIDEAIANEVTYYGGQKFQSFDELMAQMAQNVGRSPDDPDIQKLKQFFQSFWEQGGAQAPAGEQQEQPQEEQPQTTEQPQQEQGQQPEQPAEQPTGKMSFGQIVGIAIVLIIILAGIAYALAKK